MTLTKRIIPCLDVKNGRVVKGLNFESIKDAGDPVELAAKYSNEGADELVFLDITASNEQRATIKELVRKVASVINIPFTVGGGVKSIDDARNILLNGADKVGINTSAIKNPPIITELMTLFGRQCVVVAIDAKRNYEIKENVNIFSEDGRSRNKLWMKGEESGNTQKIKEILVDCDFDAIIYLVEPSGPACHTGEKVCFHHELK
jgi:cyclase